MKETATDRLFTVNESFILEAHKAACPDWKTKIEKEFPVLFVKITKKDKVEKFMKEYGLETVRSHPVIVSEERALPAMGSVIVAVPLPHANMDWTFGAFDYVKEFCRRFKKHFGSSCYPLHPSNQDAIEKFRLYFQPRHVGAIGFTEFLYINCDL